MIVSTIIDRAARTIYDETNIECSRSELFDYVQSCVHAVVAAKPDGYIEQARWQLEEGSIQVLPENFIHLVRILCNAGADGTRRGRAIEWTTLDELNRTDPNWMAAPQSNTVEQYAYDSRDQRYFYVSPPQEFPPHFVEGVGWAVPAALVDETSTIPYQAHYEDVFHAYVVGQALLKGSGRESEAPQADRAGIYMQMFTQMLQAITAGEQAIEQARKV